MKRFFRGLDELAVEVFAVGISAAVFFILSARALNSTAAHRLDTVPVVGPVVAGSRAAIDSIVSS